MSLPGPGPAQVDSPESWVVAGCLKGPFTVFDWSTAAAG